MKQALLGTAGHIDHGKSALVKALTGIDPDRLPEEKKRGITIDLGFAHLALPGMIIGIVDVPGHEKFIRHMVAGAQGIDIALLVVAANEGIMPQTQEHLQICELLGIKYGCVALTKVDLVDPDILRQTEESVRSALKKTFLDESHIIRASPVTGQGIDDLKNTLKDILAFLPSRTTEGPFRLPIDRAFSIKGFGTVVTGSVIAGRIAVGDEVEILPSGMRARIRTLQSYHQDVAEVSAGQRAALNLQGVEKTAIERGEVIVSPGFLEPIQKFYASLFLLPDARRPLKGEAEATLHIGTSRTRAAVRLLGRDALRPGEESFVSVIPEKPMTGLHGDRYILRAFAWNQTIGGGILLETAPKKERRPSPQILEELHVLKNGDVKEKLVTLLKGAGLRAATMRELSVAVRSFGLPISQALAKAMDEGVVLSISEDEYIYRPVMDDAKERILSSLAEYHGRFPLEEGLHKEKLRTTISPIMSERVFTHLLKSLSGSKKIIISGDLVKLSSHRVILTGKEKDLKERLSELYGQKGLTPPSPEEASELLKEDKRAIEELLRVLIKEGKLIRVKEKLYFSNKAISQLEERLVSFLKEKKGITTQDFKGLAGVTRKYAIPLAEYFDEKKVTLRVGEKRVLRKAPA